MSKITVQSLIEKWTEQHSTWKHLEGQWKARKERSAGVMERTSSDCAQNETLCACRADDCFQFLEDLKQLQEPSLERSLVTAVEKLEQDKHLNSLKDLSVRRAVEILRALRGGLTEHGTTPEENAVLREIGVNLDNQPVWTRQQLQALLHHDDVAAEGWNVDRVLESLLYAELIYINPASRSGFSTTVKGRDLILKFQHGQVPERSEVKAL